MNKIILALSALIAAATLSGCSTLNEAMGITVNKGNGYVIKQDKKIYGGGVHIEYRDKAFLENEVRTEMSNRMAPEAELQAALNRVPAGGRVLITYEKLTLEAANTKWLEYVVLENGVEVFRRKGRDKIAQVPKSSSGGIRFWWSIDSVDLPNPIGKPFEFIVISNLDNKRDTFTVSAP